MFSVYHTQLLDRANSKILDGDCFAHWAIQLQVRDHPVNFQLRFAIVAHGSECEVGYEVVRNTPKGEQLANTWQVFYRYQGDSEPDKAAIIAEVRAVVTNAISAISELVRNGY